MGRFAVNLFDLDIRHHPSSDALIQAILENNDSFKVIDNPISDTYPFILECENKPRDLVLWGWKWIELED